uniref:LCP family protein n=1 Tax=Nonomuraea sp. SBT364 TaxID=1580530 RepID=UPI000A7C4C28
AFAAPGAANAPARGDGRPSRTRTPRSGDAQGSEGRGGAARGEGRSGRAGDASSPEGAPAPDAARTGRGEAPPERGETPPRRGRTPSGRSGAASGRGAGSGRGDSSGRGEASGGGDSSGRGGTRPGRGRAQAGRGKAGAAGPRAGAISRIGDGLRRITGPGRETGPQFAKPLSLGGVLGWTALSAIVPGAAHLRAGRRRTGLVLVSVYAVLLLILLGAGLTAMRDATQLTWLAEWLVTATVVVAVVALAWFALIVHSYITLRPGRLNQQGQIVSGILVGILCVAVMAPFGAGATALQGLNGAIEGIFVEEPTGPSAQPIKQEDPWNGKDRVNFLLIGGDAAGNRTGMRTDSMNVASIHIPTGNTVLFSLPRNLQHVRFPPSSPLRKVFPNGYMAELPGGGLLNEVWQYANDHPEQAGGKNMGPRALMDAISFTLGLKIDYYALMNMYGFADLVDAIGGLNIRVEQDVPWGGHYGTAGTIKAGYRKLTGEQALWYGRSRVGSDDFSRMSRQRCVIGAFAQQATPSTILFNFTKIAGAARRMAQTNIPKPLLTPLLDLALKVKDGKISSLQFVPPTYWPGSPDWAKIRKATERAIKASMRPPRRAQAADVAASPGAPVISPTPSRSATAKPTQTPTRNSQKADAESLEELCGF